ncbi:hypothetical protein ANN_07389 [Periplaneta americana]|uniref:Uncharacterized protein n=1 Tax=Periplaneta americana TaxID=6978 RepID=A0ABQ8SYH4_PERAM|nr:hypothetical protein ANN_07389 [Periplaneta americana]
MDLRKVGYDDRDWINLAQDRKPMAGLCEDGSEPAGSLKAILREKRMGYLAASIRFNVQYLDKHYLIMYGPTLSPPKPLNRNLDENQYSQLHLKRS